MITRNSKFGKRRNKLWENVIAFAVFLVVLACIIGFFVYQNVKMNQKRSVLENRLQELQVQIQDLSLQEAMLKESIAETQTQEYEEKVLREQGLYKREGEEVVTILPAETGAEAVNSQEAKETKKKWWNPWTW